MEGRGSGVFVFDKAQALSMQAQAESLRLPKEFFCLTLQER
jgi:hypothetical protein